jgi:LysM repeat protein
MGRGRGGLATLIALALMTGAACRGEERSSPSRNDPTPAASPEPTKTPRRGAPAPTPVTYEVQPGDTLSEIAQRFDTTVEALAEANDIEDPDVIFPGDILKIPRGR